MATIVAVALMAAAAALAAQPVGNFVSLHLGSGVGQFRGAVHSDVLQCIKHRKVRIVRVSGPAPQVVARGFTRADGHFNIQTEEASGEWYAKVKRETRHGVDCAGARSKTRSAG